MNPVTTLLIARHGNTFGPDETVRRVGLTDLPLVESGLLQGHALGAYLKKNQLIPDVIFTSTLKRTLQTAEQAQLAMQTHLPLQPLKIFNEIDYGIDENKPETAVIARLGQAALQAWETQAHVPTGWQVNPEEIIQHWQDFSTQLTQDYRGKIILVITSNGIARFAPYLTGDFASFSAQHSIKIATGGLCLFEKTLTDSAWRCLQWNIKPPL
ncbi:MAG: histidine phosphatase family protein [Gammaproteobacteria bacterium]|nr:histidine phosphatase family protein [Gammaproteobacteria bacterium]